MHILLLFLPCLLLSSMLGAQWSAGIFLTGGDFNLQREFYDSHGFSTGIGLAPAYDFGERWGLLRLEIAVESFSGIQLPYVVNQLVDEPAYADVPISVSHRVTITGFTAYRAVLGSEMPLFSRAPRLQLTAGIGIAVSGSNRATREVFAQTIENVPLSSEQAATFSVREGEIVRAPFELPRYTGTSMRYSVGLSYTLVERVWVVLSRESRFSLWRGARGMSDYWRLGVAGTVWAGRRVQASPKQ